MDDLRDLARACVGIFAILVTVGLGFGLALFLVCLPFILLGA